jgi:hypothetical protein
LLNSLHCENFRAEYCGSKSGGYTSQLIELLVFFFTSIFIIITHAALK